MGEYRVAQICENGHCITDCIDEYPELSAAYCTKCGAKTITCCPSCNTPIRGEYYVQGVICVNEKYSVPLYCHSCGQPYPWMQAMLEIIRDAAADDASISARDTEKLMDSLSFIAADTIRTTYASSFFRSVLQRVGSELRDVLLDFAAKFAVESAKSIIFK